MRVQLFLKGTFVNLLHCQIPVGLDLTVTSSDSDLPTLYVPRSFFFSLNKPNQCTIYIYLRI